jgi:hypothetical protein
LKALDAMYEETNKYILRDIVWALKFLNQGLVGSMVGKTLGDVGKAPKKLFDIMKVPKMTSWMLKILMF